MILYNTMNAQRSNLMKTTLPEPEELSVKGLQKILWETRNLIFIGIVQKLDINDFKIIGSNFRKYVFKRKIAEVLLIKQLKPTLNK